MQIQKKIKLVAEQDNTSGSDVFKDKRFERKIVWVHEHLEELEKQKGRPLTDKEKLFYAPTMEQAQNLYREMVAPRFSLNAILGPEWEKQAHIKSRNLS